MLQYSYTENKQNILVLARFTGPKRPELTFALILQELLITWKVEPYKQASLRNFARFDPLSG